MSRTYGLLGTRLPVHPQPYSDELLTHWFFRLAHANHLKAQTLADYVFGKYSSFWARDQDKLASPEVIERLSDLSGLLPVDLRAMTLASYEGVLYEHHTPYGHTRWILPLGIYHRTRRCFGLQYCPLCLSGDKEPYFRRKWRLAFSTVCEKHGVMMLDRCYQCEAPVAFFRNDIGHRTRHIFGSSAMCDNCGANLAHAPAFDPPGPDGQVIAILRSLDNALEFGWWWAGKETVQYGHLFFDVLHHLATRLASADGRKLLIEVERQMGWSLEFPKFQRKVFELRPLHDRHWLTLMALWLLQEWPNRFVDACINSRMWQSWLLVGVEFPWWFEKIVKEQLGYPR